MKLSVDLSSSVDSTDHSVTSPKNSSKVNQYISWELTMKCNLTPAIVEHVSFRKFMQMFMPKWKLKSARHVTKTLLSLMMNDVHKKLRELLSNGFRRKINNRLYE